MKKTQKIWLGVFLAMATIPEILWSPVENAIYELSQTNQSGGTHPFRSTFLEKTDNINILSTVLFIQFLGLFLSFIYLIAIRKQVQSKMLLWLAVSCLGLLAIVTFFVFGLSVSLRNIGF
jgi:beta-lactamase regulating signal transducer with metallopeptidase domain